jgi:hypothetical protein
MGVIAAMVIGSVYVLLPTAVQVIEGPEAALADKASSVESAAPRAGPDTQIQLRAADAAAAEAAAAVLEVRLHAAHASVESVDATADGVEVNLAPGGRREVVERLAARAGRLGLYAVPDAALVTASPVPSDAVADPGDGL